jgi:hypothetical protein
MYIYFLSLIIIVSFSFLGIISLQELAIYRWRIILTIWGNDSIRTAGINILYNKRTLHFRLKFGLHTMCDIHRSYDSKTRSPSLNDLLFNLLLKARVILAWYASKFCNARSRFSSALPNSFKRNLATLPSVSFSWMATLKEVICTTNGRTASPPYTRVRSHSS